MRASLGCEITTLTYNDCLSAAVSSDVSTLNNGKCVFRGGHSARLTCRSELDGMSTDQACDLACHLWSVEADCIPAVRAYIQT